MASTNANINTLAHHQSHSEASASASASAATNNNTEDEESSPSPSSPSSSLSLKPAAKTNTNANANTNKPFQAKQFRVIVLGAGMSGLACARELIQRGYQVLVVEARDRVGGRLKGGVKTNDREGGNEGMKTLPGTTVVVHNNSEEEPIPKPIYYKSRVRKDTSTPVDLGGALIHGIDKNPIYSMAQQMGIPMRPLEDCLLFEGSGWPCDTREDERISALFNECLDESFHRIANANANANATKNNRSSASTPSDDHSTENQPPNDQTTTTTTSCSDRIMVDPSTTKDTAPDPKDVSNKNKETNGKKPAAADKSLRLVPPDSPETSFGDIFHQVCVEKGAPRNSPLFQWHQANLEVSCGASFPDLGYKWNDDEPYGYDGNHVALKTSWKPVMEGLTEGVEIMYQSPVKQVVMVVPDPPVQPPPPPAAMAERQTKANVAIEEETSQGSTPIAPEAPSSLPTTTTTTTTTTTNAERNKKKRARTPSTAPLPSTRRSRRLRGDHADARRSTRATKGQKVERLIISHFGADNYDINSPTAATITSTNHQRQRGNNQKKRPLPDMDETQTRVQVTLENGTVLEANAVVCTLPLGILKLKPEANKKNPNNGGSFSGGVRFYPPLSERKQSAIEKLGCGLLNKCILSFSHVFWQNSDFLGLAHPANSYLILNAATFTNKPILTFMYGGTFAKEVESWTDNEIVADCLEVLKIICGRRDIPSPEDYVVTRWGKEKYSRMAFTYVPPGVDGEREIKAMSEAVYDPLTPRRPVIMFAGEHTTPFHPSTIHGAFLSGIREAYRLDLFVEPEANGHLEFDEDHLYQHTFAVRKLYHTVKSDVARAPQQSTAAPATATARENHESSSSTRPQNHANRRQHRRRGAAAVMNLRERPDNAQPETDRNSVSTERRPRPRPQPQGQSHNARQNKAIYSPAARSRRSIHSINQQNKSAETQVVAKTAVSADEEALQRKKILSLEGRTLARALESFGADYSYIQSIILPVHGSTLPQKTFAQLRARCQQLVGSTLASVPVPKRVLEYWVAKNVDVPPPLGKKSCSSGKRKPVDKPEVQATRRSTREQKQREIMNL